MRLAQWKLIPRLQQKPAVQGRLWSYIPITRTLDHDVLRFIWVCLKIVYIPNEIAI